MPNMPTRKLPIRRILSHISAMPARPHRTSAALCAWLIATIGIGAWSAHFFYNGGRALAEVARSKPINPPIDWLAGVCAQAEFADFHLCAIILTSTLAALPLLAFLLRKPGRPLLAELVALRTDGPGLRQAAQALPLCLAFALSITALAHGWSAITMPASPLRWILGACMAGLLVELMFRGIILRVFATSLKTTNAVIASATLYLVFFSALFPPGIDTWEPVLSSGRYPLARSLAAGLSDPAHLFGNTLPLLAAGLSLGWARTRSHSLWLGIGIQAGLLLAWYIAPHPLPALLAAVLAVFVFCGRPSLPTSRPS
jgi:hypothetical protein